MTIREELEANLKRELIYQKYHNLIAEELKKFEGKKLTKRLEIAVKARLPEGACIYSEINGVGVFSQNYISIWNTEDIKGYDDRFRAFLGYSQDIGSYKVEMFEERDACHGRASIERVEKLKELLTTDQPEGLERQILTLSLTVNNIRELSKNDSTYVIRHRIKEVCGIEL